MPPVRGDGRVCAVMLLLGAVALAGCATQAELPADTTTPALATPAVSNTVPAASAAPSASQFGALTPGAELVLAARYGQTTTVQRLLDAGVDVDARDALGRTALMAVAGEGTTSLLRLLLERGADPALRDREGADGLTTALIKGRLDNASLLIEAGADAESRSPSGETALMATIRAGQTEGVEFLLARGADPDVHSQDDIGSGYTPLMYVARYGRGDTGLRMMRQLLRHGARAGTYRPNGETALTFAQRSGQGQMAEELRALGVRDESPYAGRNPGLQLVEAIRLGDAAKVQELLKTDIDIDFRDAATGLTPLSAAAWYGRADILDLLLRRGAALNDVPYGLREERIAVSSVPLTQRAAMYAVSRGDTALITAIRRSDQAMLERLLQAGADVTVPNREGDTPGLVAARLGRSEMLQRLIAAGLDPNMTGFSTRIPYLLTRYAGQETLVPMIVEAARHGQQDAVTVLLRAGAKPDLADMRGWTALHAAAAEGHADVIRLLLDHGAEPVPRDNAGESPLDLARQTEREDITSLLEARILLRGP